MQSIQGIFYSEFHMKAGPQLLYQAPKGCLSEDFFDTFSDYVILDKLLCNRIITVFPQKHTIVSYPICIEHSKYDRNAFFFNFGFVFRESADTELYHPIIRKLGKIMEDMEEESGYLSNEQTKVSVSHLLPRILQSLNRYGECTILADARNIINLKIFPHLPDPPEVFDHEVPVAIKDLKALLRNCAEWDLALQQVIPKIDGINYVKRISIESNVELAIVKNALKQLLYYQCIKMIDIFLHSNIYITTSKIHELAFDANLQQECVEYVRQQDISQAPQFQKLFALYCSIQPGLRICDFKVLYGKSLICINVRRFIAFGLIHGFLRRVHRYPVRNYLNENVYHHQSAAGFSSRSANQKQEQRSLASVNNTLPNREVMIQKMMNGQYNTDEICCTHMVDYGEVEKIVSNDPLCHMIHK